MKALLFAAAALAATPAGAATLPTTVTGFGNFGGSLAVLTDGHVPVDGSYYKTPHTVTFGLEEANGPSAMFVFGFGEAVTLSGFSLAVDNNDTYRLTFLDGAVEIGSTDILASQGYVQAGLETFTRAIALGRTVTAVRVSAMMGDNRYALGEARFDGVVGSVAAVPEPATWAMMIGGFALVGGAMRRRAATRPVLA